MFNFAGLVKCEEIFRKPSSPWMPFPALISVLSKFLPPSDIALISKFHKDHRVSAFDFHLWPETVTRYSLLRTVLSLDMSSVIKLPLFFRKRTFHDMN